MPRPGLFLAILLATSTSLHAQTLPLSIETPLPEVADYSPDIPTPQDVFGHEIGKHHTEPHQVVEFFRAVAEASDRVILEERGRTYEGRPLIHAMVSSPANIGRLEDIRRANVRLSDEPGAVSDSDIAAMPAVLLMGYSVHGNEASGTEAGILLLYHLAAGNGADVQEILENTVVILDPLFNPDGRARFTGWVNRNRGSVPVGDPQHREHNEPWPGGRTNHYWFDLNRDWLPAVHPESSGRLDLFHHWRPQVLTDYHEMGSERTYFFQPGIPSRTNPNTPESNQELTARIAEYHARNLDAIGSLYYTRESFDDFYYGKGSTYPDVNGAIGILFEQASSRALERETSGGLLTYAFTIRNQFAASLSTLRAAVEMRVDLLRYQRDFYADAPRIAADAPVEAFVVDLPSAPVRSRQLAALLQKHRVRVHDLAREFTASGHTYRPGEALVIPVDQPQARFIRGVMERMTEFEDSLFYDVSSWTLPLAYNLTYSEVTDNASSYVGSEMPPIELVPGRVIGERSDYAYVMPWGSYYAPRALYRLQRAGIAPRLVTQPFTMRADGGVGNFGRGSILIPVVQHALNPEVVHEMVREAAREDHVDIFAAHTGLAVDGPDLGSRGTDTIEMPRIALLTGRGTSSYNAGEVWHLLNERFDVPVTLLDVDAVEGADLSRYNTIVMAGGSYSDLPPDKLQTWVSEGGRLIAMTSAVDWIVDQDIVDLERKESYSDSLLAQRPYAEVSDASGAQRIGGSIFLADIDTTHPIAYGYDASAPFFRQGTTFYEPSEQPGTNVAVYGERPLISGYISEPQHERASESAAIVATRLGSGRIILFADNPNFRAFWNGTNGLFLNAIFFGGSF